MGQVVGMRQLLDSSSLITSQAILSTFFVCIFLLAAKLYRTIRGTKTFAAAYLCIMLAQICYSACDFSHIAAFCSLADALVTVGSALEYFGLQELFNEVGRRSRLLTWAGVALTILLAGSFLLYPPWGFCNPIVYCLFFFSIRCAMARLLFRHAKHNRLVRAFAIVMTAFTLYAPNQFVRQILSHNGILTIFGLARVEIVFLLANILFSSLLGFFLIFLVVQRILHALEKESLSDPLTGKLNRRALDQMLGRELNRALRQRASVSVAIIDIDNFKTINDRWGHAAGDDAIRSVASLIAAHVRPYDEFGRHGGDELMIIMPSTEREQAIAIAERICHKVSEAPQAHGAPLSLSIGVAQSERGDSIESLLQRADTALYQAKNEGRSRVRFHPFTPFPAH
ncbi:MAG: GGDEF domain-containing protein [Edaphobacter sp.]|uniref:GGDEF domain-containing protein n=1 Tax=Edaphobacter sp. TaxID=1934404 RepID=UPI0023880E7B|nr:GGDEF domain-containing protein [Edaphobacter sp.]MDE1176960.1 GGDEF domain-containing protein [Edaphobacter sp.]